MRKVAPLLLLALLLVSACSNPTARCVDGTYSYSEHRQGTCSHHGGVAQWLPAGGQTTSGGGDNTNANVGNANVSIANANVTIPTNVSANTNMNANANRAANTNVANANVRVTNSNIPTFDQFEAKLEDDRAAELEEAAISDGWRVVGHTASAVLLYHPRRVEHPTTRFVNAWFKEILEAPVRRNRARQFKMSEPEVKRSQYAGYMYTLSRYSFNCAAGEMRMLSEVLYDGDGGVIQDHDDSYRYEGVVPDSIGETMLQTVCKDDSQPLTTPNFNLKP